MKKKTKFLLWVCYWVFWLAVFLAAREYALEDRATDYIIGNENAWGGEILVPVLGILLYASVKILKNDSKKAETEDEDD